MGDENEMGSLFVNSIIRMSKKDYAKLVIDARYLNPVSDINNCSWLLEPVQTTMTRLKLKVSELAIYLAATIRYLAVQKLRN